MSRPVMRGVSRSSRYAGRDAVARQRQAGARVAGRKPGSRTRTRKGVRNIRRSVSGARHGRRTTLCAGLRSGNAWHERVISAPAQVVWSCEIRSALFTSDRRRKVPRRRRRQPEGVAGESTKQAGAPPRAERRMQTGAAVVTNSCAFFIAHEAADALAHPAFRAPSFGRSDDRNSGAPAPS